MNGGMKEHIRATPPFNLLSEESLATLERAGEWNSLAQGQELFAFGDEGDAMYLVVEGHLQAVVPGKNGESIVVAELGPTSMIGEIHLLTGGKRSATVRSLTPARLIKFRRTVFDQLSAAAQDAVAEINTMILRRLRRNHLAVILTKYFGVLPYAQLEEIESSGEWLRLEAGAPLFRQGEPSHSLYVLVSGSLGVRVRETTGRETLVGRIRPGELVGDMALLTEEPHSATVYAIREAELVRFSRRDFAPLLERHPRFLLQLARLNISRLKERAGSGEKESATTIISLLPTAGTSLGHFARELAEAMSAYATVLQLSSANTDQILRMPGVAQSAKVSPLSTRFAAWLSSQEQAYRFILLEADPDDSNWTRRCIGQSDQVITVGQAGTDPAVKGPEAGLYSGHLVGVVPKRLVLLHPRGQASPTGTARWLEPRRVEMHHHVRLGNQADIQRLARFLCGSAIGLALGGGGARGFAHIGAYRALLEAEIPIDVIAGTSMGAVIGAEIALGFSPEKMIEVNRGLFRNSGLLLDLTLPLLSFTTGKAYAGSLRQVFGEVAIEDLWTPYFCVSSNISRAAMTLHRTGLLRKKVRASSGVQGLFPPVVMDGELHVDGALFSNLPADALKSVCRGKVIAVDVTPPVDLAQHMDYGDTISGWRILWKRLFPGRSRRRIADLGTIMQRSAEAASMANQRRVIENLTDFYLQMPVQDIHLMQFGAINRLADIGYQTTRDKIAEWRADPAWQRRLYSMDNLTSDSKENEEGMHQRRLAAVRRDSYPYLIGNMPES